MRFTYVVLDILVCTLIGAVAIGTLLVLCMPILVAVLMAVLFKRE